MFNLTNTDKAARSLCGLPLFLGELEIYPIKIKEIIEIGDIKYNYHLMIMTSLNDVMKSTIDDKESIKKELLKKSDFEICLILCVIYSEFQKQICEAIQFFLKKDIMFNKELEQFEVYDGDKILQTINNDNYDQLVQIIKFQSYLSKHEEAEPANEKARKLQEKKKKAQEQVNRAKQRDTTPLTIADYISIVNSKNSNIDIKECLDMTVYSLFDYIERLALIDNYEVGIKQLLAGAKPNQVNLKHWLSQL